MHAIELRHPINKESLQMGMVIIYYLFHRIDIDRSTE